jgi:hypothetical protein
MDEALHMIRARGVPLDMLRVRGFPFHQDVSDFIADHFSCSSWSRTATASCT